MKLSTNSLVSLLAALVLLFGFSATSAHASGWAGKEVYGIAPDGSELHWVVYQPDGPGPWPVVLVIHGGGFKGGGPASGAPVALDLAAAGYLALSIEYRLAPNGSIAGQVSDGRYPQQSDDVKMAVRAARRDPRGNGQVGAVGGSAGGYHTAYVAATGTAGDDRIDVGASLSGAYDFTDFSGDPNINTFINDVTNYVGVTEFATDALRAASPVALVDASVPPLFLINSAQDTMPFSQLADMTTKLDSLGVNNYQALTLSGSLHAFDYWSTVKDQVIAFLANGFAGIPNPTPTPTPTPTPSPVPPIAPQLVNVSTRAQVGSDDQVMIGGFIITGSKPKSVVLRALGPSLGRAGVANALADPVLDLYDASGALLITNDDWSSLPPEIAALGLAPSEPAEAVIATTLPAGHYTAVLRGNGGSAGVGLLELYDVAPDHSTLSNISTRAETSSSADPIIGGFIVGEAAPAKVLVRALGPSLRGLGVNDAIADPILELRNADGSLLVANDSWRSTQQDEIIATTIPPADGHEAAIVATLTPGSYTAIVRDQAGASGIGLVEIYALPND